MKQCGCDFCNDLRNIEPANYISGGDEEIQEFLKRAREKKQFIHHYHMFGGMVLRIVDKCPVCGYQFTEEDYASYD